MTTTPRFHGVNTRCPDHTAHDTEVAYFACVGHTATQRTPAAAATAAATESLAATDPNDRDALLGMAVAYATQAAQAAYLAAADPNGRPGVVAGLAIAAAAAWRDVSRAAQRAADLG